MGITTSGGSVDVVHANEADVGTVPGYASLTEYDVARLGLKVIGSAEIAEQDELSDKLANAGADGRGLAFSAAGGAGGATAVFYTLRGSGASWTLYEHLAPTPAQDMAESVARSAAGNATVNRSLALTLPGGYGSMTCHDVAVSGGKAIVLATVTDKTYLIPVTISSFTAGAAVQALASVPTEVALGTDNHVANRVVMVRIVFSQLVAHWYAASDLSSAVSDTVLSAVSVTDVQGCDCDASGNLFVIADDQVRKFTVTTLAESTVWDLFASRTDVIALAEDSSRGSRFDDWGADLKGTFSVLAKRVYD